MMVDQPVKIILFISAWQREAMLVSRISGRPGTLREFVNLAVPEGTQLNITELRHRCVACSHRFPTCSTLF